MGLVLWKPLYYTSITMFVLSGILFPISTKWSMIVILALVALWSRIPGLVFDPLTSMSLHDLFTFIIAVNIGGVAGGFFGAFVLFFSHLFGPEEWFPYVVMASVGTFTAALLVPSLIETGGLVVGFYIYETILYVVYWTLNLTFYRNLFGVAILYILPIIFFDFIVNPFFVSLFGGTLSKMLTQGLSSGWPFIVFSGIIILFLYLAKNGKDVSDILETMRKKIIDGRKNNLVLKGPQPREEKKENRPKRGLFYRTIRGISS